MRSAIRVNPLIETSTISSISFSGDLPEGVAGVSYHPADSAVNNYNTLLSDAVEEDIGSVVITLKQQPDEDNLEEYISGLLTATIRYKSTLTYGTGSAMMYLKELSDNEWSNSFSQYSFWAKKGYLRATSIDEDSTKIDVYLDGDDLYSSVYLSEGETSETIYYPGYYCTAGFQLKLVDVAASEDMALVYVNDNTYWVTGNNEEIGDTGCKVKNLNVLPGGSGSLTVYCSSASIDLSIKDRGVNLTNSTGGEKTLHVGDYILEGNKKYYLGYIGEDQTDIEDSYIVLFNESLTTDDLSLINNAYSGGDVNDLSKALDSLVNSNNKVFKDKYEVIKLLKQGTSSKISFKSFSSYSETASESELADAYKTNFTGGNNVVFNLTEIYPNEEKNNGEYWGEEALFKQIEIAEDLEDLESLYSLTNKFLETYPSSNLYNSVQQIQNDAGIRDFSNARGSILVNNDLYEFYVADFVSGNDYNNFSMFNIYGVKGEEWVNSDASGAGQIRVTELDVGSIKLTYTYVDGTKKTASAEIEEGNTEVLASGTDYSVSVRLKSSSVDPVAQVKLIPKINNDVTQTNFSFGITVEKRSIELTPEQANETAQNLEDKIAFLRSTSDFLKKTVTVGNELCTAVTAGFTVSNFIGGLNGETTARTIVNNYYKDYCSSRIDDDYSILDCYDNERVEDVVDEVKEAISEVNKFITKVRGDDSSSGLKDFFSSLLGKDLADLTLEMVTSDSEMSSFADNSITINEVEISFSKLTDSEQIRAALLYDELGCTSGKESKACTVAKKYLESELSSLTSSELKRKLFLQLEISEEEYYEASRATDEIEVSTLGTSSETIGDVTLAAKSNYKIIGYKNAVYLANRSKDEEGEYSLFEYNLTTNKFSPIPNKFRFSFVDPTITTDKCSSGYNNPKVIYYSSGYAEGQPSVIPVRPDEGFYATVPATISLGYDDSGYVNFMWLCNVGEDKIMNKASGDDVCIGIDTSNPTYSALCSDADSATVKKMYEEAITLIRTAQKNPYKSLSVDGKVIAAENISGTDELDCLDYMSAEQCRTLFNVCDPVVCPSSRCDLGGRVNDVEDVTTTGIIGSLVLCSQNDVVLPICVTGLYVGIENLLAATESYQSCLMTRAETGEYVGICDSAYSLYLCDMFWDAVPYFWEGALPNLLDVNKDSSGGGEYLVGADSLQNVEDSISYFTNYYANNVFDSFQIENTLQLNTSVCDIGNFVSNGSISSNLFGDIITDFFEPDTPAQTYAYFSESVYTTQTTPATSQYKVYYQVFAGNEDSTVKYSVYLKNPDENYLLILPEYVLLTTDTLSEGESASETLDFTAPAGYKELCVSLNEDEYCGFGSTSSNSFASDYASDLYTIAQASDNGITTALGCQSTSVSSDDLSSLYDLYSSGSSSSDVSSYGITRVCSSTNPGSSTGSVVYCSGPSDTTSCSDGYECTQSGTIYVCHNDTKGDEISSYWADVGYCDVESIRCWLDKSSVEEVLNVMNLSSLEEALGSSSKLTSLESYYKDVSEELDDIYDRIGNLKVSDMNLTEAKILIGMLETISGVSDDVSITGKGNNAQKAEALAYEANIYRLLIGALRFKDVDVRVEGSKTPEATTETPTVIQTSTTKTAVSQDIKTVLGDDYSLIGYTYDLLIPLEGVSGDYSGEPTGEVGLTTETYNAMKSKYGESISQKEASFYYLYDSLQILNGLSGFSDLSERAKMAILAIAYNLDANNLVNKDKYPNFIASVKRSDEVGAMKNLLDTANDNGQSVKGLAVARAILYNFVSFPDDLIDQVIQREGGLIIYWSGGSKVESYTPTDGRYSSSIPGTVEILGLERYEEVLNVLSELGVVVAE